MRLGVNIDHVATLRNARGGTFPDPLHAALLAHKAGADGITAHLREDRRHIRDVDITRFKEECALPLNLEMAATGEMVAIALATLPHAVCIVPEKRDERTTEGGLDVMVHKKMLAEHTRCLKGAGIRVSFFITPAQRQIEASREAGAQVVELHTGKYCEETGAARARQLQVLAEAAAYACRLGLECHGGHGLSYETVAAVAAIPHITELNIGHFLIGEAVSSGLEAAVRRMKTLMQEARR